MKKSMPKKPILQEAFYTKELSEKGVKLPLTLPDGTKTEHSFTLLSVDSKVFKKGVVRINQKFLKKAGDPKKPIDKIDFNEEKNLHYLALLIKDWTFPGSCTEANKVDFLRNSPANAEIIDLFCNQRSNFFVKPS